LDTYEAIGAQSQPQFNKLLVGKSLSFSKSEEMHEVCLRLFPHGYNLALIACD